MQNLYNTQAKYKPTVLASSAFSSVPVTTISNINFLLQNYKIMHPKKVLLLMQKIINNGSQSKKHIHRKALKTCRQHLQNKSPAFVMALINNNQRLFIGNRWACLHCAINYSFK